jgi:hypothetical protein
MLFELQLQVDFLGVATEIVTNVRARCDTLVHEWTAHRIQSTDPSDSETYAGTYTNTGLAMTLEVVPTDIDRSAGHGMWTGRGEATDRPANEGAGRRSGSARTRV